MSHSSRRVQFASMFECTHRLEIHRVGVPDIRSKETRRDPMNKTLKAASKCSYEPNTEVRRYRNDGRHVPRPGQRWY